jgi:hypothetical protein
VTILRTFLFNPFDAEAIASVALKAQRLWLGWRAKTRFTTRPSAGTAGDRFGASCLDLRKFCEHMIRNEQVI